MPIIGGRSKDRHCIQDKERPVRKGYPPYRIRAIVYTLIETGMRRAAIRNIDLDDVDFERRLVHVEEKGGHTNTAYSIQYARITDQELAEAIDDR